MGAAILPGVVAESRTGEATAPRFGDSAQRLSRRWQRGLLFVERPTTKGGLEFSFKKGGSTS